MTDKLRAAAEAAIGAMVRAAITGHSDALDGYAEALRAALAEPEVPKIGFGNMEPVAYIEHHKGGDNLVWDREKYMKRTTPLYTIPPRREWVSLTDEEIASLSDNVQFGSRMAKLARIIEAALKEKNHD